MKWRGWPHPGLKSPFVRFALLMPLVIVGIVGAVFYPLYQKAEAHIRDEVHAAIEQEILALDDHLHDRGWGDLVAAPPPPWIRTRSTP